MAWVKLGQGRSADGDGRAQREIERIDGEGQDGAGRRCCGGTATAGRRSRQVSEGTGRWRDPLSTRNGGSRMEEDAVKVVGRE